MSAFDPPGSASEAWPRALRTAPLGETTTPAGAPPLTGTPPAGAPLVGAPQHGDGPTAPEPFRSVGFTLSSLGYAVARGFTEVLAPLEIEPRDFALLRALAATEGDSQQAIGERLGVPASRMVGFIDAHEARGLIERRQAPADRRVHALHLTDAGHELLTRAFAIALAFEQELCGDLSSPEREQLLELLARVSSRLGLTPGVHAAQGGDDPHGA
jgi:DNA-binding MarR family transcriptional regulator